MAGRGALPGFLEKIPQDGARELRAGGVLFRQGDPATHLFVLQSGQVKLERITAEGRRVLMYRALAGDTIAEAALFASSYHCDAVAVEPSRVLRLPGGAVRDALRSDPEAADALLAHLAGQVRSLRTRLETRSILSARDRILHHLRISASEDGRVALRSSLMGLAAELGLAHETLYREMAALEREGRVERRGRILRLRDDPGL